MQLIGISTLSAFLALTLISCGGGSSSDGGSPINFVADAPITVTTENSAQIIGEAIAVTMGDVSAPTRDFRSDRLNQAAKSSVLLIASAHLPGEPGFQQTSFCLEGELNINLHPDTPQDVISGSLEFLNCVTNEGQRINGQISLLINNGSGTIIFNDYSVRESAFTVNLDGEFDLTVQDFANHRRFTSNGSGAVLTVSSPNKNIELGNYQETANVFDSEGFTTFDLSFLCNSSSLGGSFALNSENSLVVLDGGRFPTAGQVLISGASGSKLLATIEGGTEFDNLLVEIDSDGDDLYEASKVSTWREIIDSAFDSF